MKRKRTGIGILLLACFFLTGSLSGCRKDESHHGFEAVVLEVQEDYIMVDAKEGQTVVGEVQVWIGSLAQEEVAELQIGDRVCILDDGKMTMSLPPQMSAVAIEILEE